MKCSNRMIATAYSYKKLSKDQQVFITLSEDLDACAKIITRHYQSTDASSAVYNPLKRPADLINFCESIGCKNTGTLLLNTNTKTVNAVFATASDATDYFAGILYFYVFLPANKTVTVRTTLSDITDNTPTNGDVYETKITSKAEGFYPVTIDLSVAPSEEIGTGWTGSTSGTTVKIEFEQTVAEEGEPEALTFGISSISFFDSTSDLEGNETIALSCLSGHDGDTTVDALEEACGRGGYDDESIAIEHTLTARQFTPNMIKLNPLIHKGVKSQSFAPFTKSFTVQEEGEYGVVHISDMFNEECGLLYVNIEDDCNITDSVMYRVNNPNLMNLNERQFQVMNNLQNPTLDIVGSKLYFNKEIVGKKVNITFPKTVEVTENYYATDEGINDRRAKMHYTRHLADGVAEVYTYNNILITSFPMGLQTSDNEFEFTISVQKDNNGKFYNVDRYNEAGLTL